jgi:hypothetical protein
MNPKMNWKKLKLKNVKRFGRKKDRASRVVGSRKSTIL